MKSFRYLRPLLFSVGALLVVPSCTTVKPSSNVDNYNATAYRPTNPSKVRVKVSLAEQMIYVLEGDKPLLVTATCVGTQAKPTPRGNFRAYKKIAKKRSGSYGFAVRKDAIIPTKAGATSGRYVGYPMAYWVEFAPQYGFHSGYVWPMPRSHGCLRLHPKVAPKFYALVKEGTPINISHTQPEDATLGKGHVRPGPAHFNAPDPASSLLISDAIFSPPTEPLFAN